SCPPDKFSGLASRGVEWREVMNVQGFSRPSGQDRAFLHAKKGGVWAQNGCGTCSRRSEEQELVPSPTTWSVGSSSNLALHFGSLPARAVGSTSPVGRNPALAWASVRK